MTATHNVFLGLGANLGDKELTIVRAYRHIERLVGTIRRQSAFYYSEPWGFRSAKSFVNTVVSVETAFTPIEVLHRTRLIERLLGKRREHATERKGGAGQCKCAPVLPECAPVSPECAPISSDCASVSPDCVACSSEPAVASENSAAIPLYHDRPIDIDLLLYDDLTLNTPKLVVPHPLMWQRDFVMQPLLSILSEADKKKLAALIF